MTASEAAVASEAAIAGTLTRRAAAQSEGVGAGGGGPISSFYDDGIRVVGTDGDVNEDEEGEPSDGDAEASEE